MLRVREISEVQGQHLSGKTNDDMRDIYFDRKTMNFFPRGLTKFFKIKKLRKMI
jgi:hypothetical protein